MADDKSSGGGGWQWNALEIIIVLVLVIGLVEKIDGNKAAAPTSTTSATITNRTITGSTCGLTLLQPVPLQKVVGAAPLVGNVAGCDWEPTDQVALYAQLVDSHGTPVSSYMPVPATDRVGDSATFSSTIVFSRTPAHGTGYLILVPAMQPDTVSDTITARLPITF